jgi:hypothetical protein
MKNKHTSGPWAADGLVITSPGRSIVCWMGEAAQFPGDMVKDCENSDANGRLIAAAPDLYAALQRMLSPTGYTGDNSITKQAKAALAKARGETE